MKIRHVSVKNFRGIRELEWDVKSDVVCLIGPGDATKTTVLDAITYTLASGHFLRLNDADFYAANVDEPIVIEVTVTYPPRHLLTENKYALFQRGWSSQHGLTDDPSPDGEPALTIRLQIDDSLEPGWTVTKQSNEEGRGIGWRDRLALQLFRVGDNIDSHLTWGRGSALTALTGAQDEIDSTLTDAYRQAREAVFAAPHEKLNAAAAAAYEHAVAFGIPAGPTFRPGLDPGAIGGATRLTLHQENVPLAYAGLGTKRLAALAMQRAGILGRSIVLVDEVEHGLEPFRLLHLLQWLREAVAKSEEGASLGQVFLTTHSADAVAELTAEDLHVVRSVDGITSIQHVPDAFADSNGIDPQAIVRAGAAALLARRVIVAEGQTEVGYLRAMARVWETANGIPIAHCGTTTMDGGGQQAATRAVGFACLGYETALFVDSDAPVNPSATSVRESGVEVIQWDDGVSIEERIARDLPDQAISRFVQLAIELVERQDAVCDAIQAQLPPQTDVLDPADVLAVVTNAVGPDVVRDAIGKAAKKRGWFKGIDQGERLGDLVSEFLPQMVGTDTAVKTANLESFAYGNLEDLPTR